MVSDGSSKAQSMIFGWVMCTLGGAQTDTSSKILSREGELVQSRSTMDVINNCLYNATLVVQEREHDISKGTVYQQ